MDSLIVKKKQMGIALKIALIICAVILFVGGIIGVLVGANLLGKTGSCAELEEKTGLSYCEDKFTKIVFVVGDTANTPKPALDKTYAGIISHMYAGDKHDFTYISVSDPDGGVKNFRKKSSLKLMQEEITEKLSNSRASKDGADYLEAIRMAAKQIGENDNGLIYVIGSGLSDSGLLNFADDDLLLSHNVDDVKNALKLNKAEQRELEGITIVWQGMGETVAPQEALTRRLSDKLESYYRTVLSEYGLDERDLYLLKNSEERVQNDVDTKVKTTHIEKELIIVDSGEDSELAFIPDTSTFKYPAEAKVKAREWGSKYRNHDVTIRAYVSRGMCDWSADTSLIEGRANAVKGLLISEGGISESDITILEGGIGPANECPNGYGHYAVDENEAPKNRIVRITFEEK